MKCLNIIVYYDNKEEVEKYISEVKAIGHDQVEIALVVNKDSEKRAIETAEFLQKSGMGRVIDYRDNVGYLNAMLKTIRGLDMNPYDYVILSNTDIHFEQKDFFTQLSRKEYHDEIGCIAPSVFSTKIQGYQNPHYRERVSREHFERLSRVFSRPALGRLYLGLSGLKGKMRRKAAQRPSSCYVYSPNGAFMIFTRAFIRIITGYEYGVRLYSEESCIGELLRLNGMKCYYDDSIEVMHQESTVTGKVDYRKRFSAWKESIDYILREFYGNDNEKVQQQ